MKYVFIRRKRALVLYCVVTVVIVTVIVNVFDIICFENINKEKNGVLQPEQKSQLLHKQYELQKREAKLFQMEHRLLQIKTELQQQYPSQDISVLLSSSSHLPTIFAITPTYARPVQKAELVRLSQTLLHVKNFHWIVVEDSESETRLVKEFLQHSGLKYTLLNVATPKDYKLKQNDPNWLKPRGVLQRNLGIKWIRDNVDSRTNPGVVYFLDDDNTYDLKVFEEMRNTKKISVWPVALVGALRYESPIVENGKVTGWFTYWRPERPFAMDMAGFAINIRLFFEHPSAWFSLEVKRGYQESSLLTQLKVTMLDLEPKADNCSKILVWHTRTEKVKLTNEARFIRKRGYGSDLKMQI